MEPGHARTPANKARDPAAAYIYVAENDGQLADDAMAAVFAQPNA